MNGKRFGKTIRLFLMDGIPNGRISCELSNWSGKAYKIPRGFVKDCSDRPELNSTGVYLLFGKTEGNAKKGVVYIGEAENIFKRLSQHLREKDFWNDAIVFGSKDDNLNKAHIKYVEHKMYKIAEEANRFSILNSTIPTLSLISEPDMEEMEEFIENTKMIIPILGYKVFESLRNIENDNSNEETLFIKSARGAEAVGQQTNDGFLVLQNSKISDDYVKSFSKSFIKLRNKLIEDETIRKNGDQYILAEDYLFSSPSTAAAIVMGRNANGLTEWKTKDGRSLKSVESG